ncbi:DUF6542 domain-containing protein [Streptomyces sp. TLI_171]|uniref:DUF6542 domain-containing protein n=1 Tax=Streptomyces sp. TLI_171 TaxID=1938859 RepID=UPI000C1A2E6C|nr:DUF6542 domain-containing protein [Streptomyces sp. TLI_171]RKE16945.1 hypothetical protein BX266_0191 [Streptomyces sp. TLI_171]
MTGRRTAGTRDGAPLWRDEHAPRTATADPAGHPVPPQRGPRPAAAPRGGRAAAPAVAAPNRMPAVLPALGLPLLGALADELLGSGPGALYTLCAVLGAAMAALVSSRAGWWWVASGAPVVTLATAFGVAYLAHGERYRGAGLATQGLKLVSGQFWPMVGALAAALLAVAVRIARTRRPRRARGPRRG